VKFYCRRRFGKQLQSHHKPLRLILRDCPHLGGHHIHEIVLYMMVLSPFRWCSCDGMGLMSHICPYMLFIC